jgi:hypothetical protein
LQALVFVSQGESVCGAVFDAYPGLSLFELLTKTEALLNSTLAEVFAFDV